MIEAALLTSATALAVSGVALYLASLRPAEIAVDFVADLSGPRSSVMSGDGLPSDIELVVAVFISNEGARGGVLQGLGAFNPRFKGSDEWQCVGPSSAHPRPTTHTPAMVFPVAYEAGDAAASFLILKMDPKAKDAQGFAAALKDLHAIDLELSWSYQRSVGFLRRRRRELVTRSHELTLDPRSWRAELVKSWQLGPGGLGGPLAPLADIAQGIRTPTALSRADGRAPRR